MVRRCLDCPALIPAGSRCPACDNRRRSGYTRSTWARQVKRRANHTCEHCGAREPTMYAHHIVPLSQGGAQDSPLNGQCLCKRCHEVIHYD